MTAEIMKLAVACIALLISGAVAFAPSLSGRCIASSSSVRFAGPEDEEGGGLDLDLEEMFDMYVLTSILFLCLHLSYLCGRVSAIESSNQYSTESGVNFTLSNHFFSRCTLGSMPLIKEKILIR